MHDSPFDSTEQAVLADAGFFLTKAAIDAKINALFGELKTEIEQELKSMANFLPIGFPASGGRIYRGEHHGPYPWRAVDCPLCFEKEGYLTFRCLLLWGHHFSFHLLLSGKWLDFSLPRIEGSLPQLGAAQLQLSTGGSLWDWEMDPQRHLPLSACTPALIRRQASKAGQLKLSLILPLENAGTLVSTGIATWRLFQDCLFLD